MAPHGPDTATVLKASAADTTQPQAIRDTLAFMFETRTDLHPTAQALSTPTLQADYWRCWQDLPRRFDPSHS